MSERERENIYIPLDTKKIMIQMTSRNFFVIERRVNKRKLLDLIRANAQMSLRKVKGIFSLKTGLSFNKINEYLGELEAAGLIELSDKMVKVIE